MSSSGLSRFRLTFEYSPIILTGGIAQNLPGGMVPIITILDPDGADEDDFFANFIPLPGTTLVDQDVATYPFANQAVAANAVIAKPLAVSFKMIVPVKRDGGYGEKLQIMTSLQSTLQRHNASGGTYILATPSAYFENCVMTTMRDVTPQEGGQAQVEWQLDFMKPLLTLQDAQQAMNGLMSKVTNGTKIDGTPAWSGLQQSVGDPSSLAGTSVEGNAQALGGAGIQPGQ